MIGSEGVRKAVSPMLAMGLLLAAGAAQAESGCAAPPPPPSQAMRPMAVGPAPTPPPCIQAGHHGVCGRGDVTLYNLAVDRRNAQVAAWNGGGQAYVQALNLWTRQTADYARCEIDRMNAEVPH
jgi:hypothetical protein